VSEGISKTQSRQIPPSAPLIQELA